MNVTNESEDSVTVEAEFGEMRELFADANSFAIELTFDEIQEALRAFQLAGEYSVFSEAPLDMDILVNVHGKIQKSMQDYLDSRGT